MIELLLILAAIVASLSGGLLMFATLTVKEIEALEWVGSFATLAFIILLAVVVF